MKSQNSEKDTSEFRVKKSQIVLLLFFSNSNPLQHHANWLHFWELTVTENNREVVSSTYTRLIDSTQALLNPYGDECVPIK